MSWTISENVASFQPIVPYYNIDFNANFIRIKINICDICKTIYNVSAKNNNGMKLKEVVEYLKEKF